MEGVGGMVERQGVVSMGIKDFSARGIGKADGPELVTGKQQEFAVLRLLSAQSARNEQLA